MVIDRFSQFIQFLHLSVSLLVYSLHHKVDCFDFAEFPFVLEHLSFASRFVMWFSTSVIRLSFDISKIYSAQKKDRIIL